MATIVPIVEGHAEVESIPIVMRRLQEDLGVFDAVIGRPVRVKRNQIVKPGQLERRVELARRREDCGAIMIVLDADDDCPKELAPQLLERSRQVAGNLVISVVMPKHELEAWFLGSIDSLGGERGIRNSVGAPEDPEGIRDAKTWLTRAMSGERTYVSTDDQPALMDRFDLAQAYSACRSFRKFKKDFELLLKSLTS